MRLKAPTLIIIIIVAAGLGVSQTGLRAQTPVPSTYNWSGLYVGAIAGYNWARAAATYGAPGFQTGGFFPADQSAVSAAGSTDLKPNSFTGGAELGYNWQFTNVIVGIESDFQYIGLHSAFDGTFVTPNAITQVTHTDIKADWLYTLRGRLGLTWDHTYIFGTGGLAVADIRFNQTNSFFNIPQITSDQFDVSQTRAGWTIGGGVEHAFLDRWSLKVEYLYVDLGNVSGTSSTTRILLPALPGSIAYSHNVDVKENIVRVGFNYKL